MKTLTLWAVLFAAICGFGQSPETCYNGQITGDNGAGPLAIDTGYCLIDATTAPTPTTASGTFTYFVQNSLAISQVILDFTPYNDMSTQIEVHILNPGGSQLTIITYTVSGTAEQVIAVPLSRTLGAGTRLDIVQSTTIANHYSQCSVYGDYCGFDAKVAFQ